MSSSLSISASHASSVRSLPFATVSSSSTAAAEDIAAASSSSSILINFPDHSRPCVRSDCETPYPQDVEFPPCPGVFGKVGTYDSIVSSSTLYKIAVKYNFPSSALLLQPRAGDRACRPPRGCVTVYVDHFKAGLRIPFPAIYGEIFTIILISPPPKLLPTASIKLPGWGLHVLG